MQGCPAFFRLSNRMVFDGHVDVASVDAYLQGAECDLIGKELIVNYPDGRSENVTIVDVLVKVVFTKFTVYTDMVFPGGVVIEPHNEEGP